MTTVKKGRMGGVADDLVRALACIVVFVVVDNLITKKIISTETVSGILQNLPRPKILIAMPAFNEEYYIYPMVINARRYADEVLVVDDGSTDRTASIASLAGAAVIRHGHNMGYGVAIQAIFRTALLTPDVDCLVVLDSDNQHDPSEIPLLVEFIAQGWDVSIGSRNALDIPKMRRLGGWVLSVATQVLSGSNVRDSQSGFRAYSRRALGTLILREKGMAVSSEIVALASWNKLKIVEVPISVRYTGDSSTHNPWKQGFYTLWRIVVMIVRRRLWHEYPNCT